MDMPVVYIKFYWHTASDVATCYLWLLLHRSSRAKTLRHSGWPAMLKILSGPLQKSLPMPVLDRHFHEIPPNVLRWARKRLLVLHVRKRHGSWREEVTHLFPSGLFGSLLPDLPHSSLILACLPSLVHLLSCN